MKAIGYRACLPISDPAALIDLDLPMPQATGRDLLVKVEAVSVNPVDYKVRLRSPPPAGQAKVLGYDAAGVVQAASPVREPMPNIIWSMSVSLGANLPV